MELTIDQALQQGVAAHKEGKLEDAERLYRAILQSQPTHPVANHNLGVLAVGVGKVAAALPYFKAAVSSNSNQNQFWLSYIDALIKLNQFDTAKQVIEEGKKQGVDGEILSPLETQILTISQQVSSAGSIPTETQMTSLLAHYEAGRFGDAEQLALSMTGQFPGHPLGWKVLGAVLGLLGKTDE